MREVNELRPIAFYLPQYHPIPENDQWWGEGFTEWTNVRKALPRFDGHHQPHVPAQLGYYDLRSPETQAAQAELAGQYGIYGFCYYHYWFNGKRLLEHPITEVLKSGKPDFPFCLCWANENWTRRWDGEEREVLMAQEHSHEDDLEHIESLIPVFRDPRYIRVDGKPLFLVYKTNLLPDPKATAEIWREAARKGGIGELYLVRVENGFQGHDPSPLTIGFDAAVEFAPNWGSLGPEISGRFPLYQEYRDSNPRIYDYDNVIERMLGRRKPDYKLFRGAFPSWDNSARRRNEPVIFAGSSPEKFAFWLSQIARYTLENFQGEERLLFINAWNEWGEGCHLEPDRHYGLRHLEATRHALQLAQDVHAVLSSLKPSEPGLPFSPERWYATVAELYSGGTGVGASDLKRLQSFAPYALYTMLPLVHQSVQDQIMSQLISKEEQIKELHESVSWRITAPLRKLFDVLFK